MSAAGLWTHRLIPVEPLLVLGLQPQIETYTLTALVKPSQLAYTFQDFQTAEDPSRDLSVAIIM